MPDFYVWDDHTHRKKPNRDMPTVRQLRNCNVLCLRSIILLLQAMGSRYYSKLLLPLNIPAANKALTCFAPCHQT